MTRITPEHLSRAAWVYVRQSTPSQVRHNHESRGRQYALKDRARQLGWSDVVLVDDDLGRSGGGTERPGYDRLLAAVCRGEVGAVLSLEASRLARNGREWHTLIDYCGLVGCLLADETCVYDPRLPDDRLLLGMKGAMSEMELSTLRFRSVEALRRKARRGELFMTVAVGYVRVDRDRIGMDPDQRVRETVALVFRKFAEFGSIRQVHLWLCQEGVELPAVVFDQSQRRVVWKLPGYTTVHRILTNPVYAGAYAFGRTGSRTYLENGRKRVVRGFRRERDEWEVPTATSPGPSTRGIRRWSATTRTVRGRWSEVRSVRARHCWQACSVAGTVVASFMWVTAGPRATSCVTSAGAPTSITGTSCAFRSAGCAWIERSVKWCCTC